MFMGIVLLFLGPFMIYKGVGTWRGLMKPAIDQSQQRSAIADLQALERFSRRKVIAVFLVFFGVLAFITGGGITLAMAVAGHR